MLHLPHLRFGRQEHPRENLPRPAMSRHDTVRGALSRNDVTSTEPRRYRLDRYAGAPEGRFETVTSASRSLGCTGGGANANATAATMQATAKNRNAGT